MGFGDCTRKSFSIPDAMNVKSFPCDLEQCEEVQTNNGEVLALLHGCLATSLCLGGFAAISCFEGARLARLAESTVRRGNAFTDTPRSSVRSPYMGWSRSQYEAVKQEDSELES